jgi:hypothetical protein
VLAPAGSLALPEVDLVPVGVADRRHPLAPLHVLRLADDLYTRLAQRVDLGVELLAVEPERRTACRLEVVDRRQAERERAEADEHEAVAEPVALLESEPLDVEGGRLGEIAAVKDRERVAEAQVARVATRLEAMCFAICRASRRTPPTFSDVNEYRKSSPTK